MEETAEKFDPEIHQTDGEGNPVVKGDGSFARKRGPKASPRAATSPRRGPKKATPRAGSRPKAPDFRPGINGMFQLAAAPLAFVQPLDAIAVSQHGENIAEALNALAQERPEVAMVLQRILSVGPYGAVIAAVVPLAVQILHNHDMLPREAVERIPGVTPKEVLEAALGLGETMDRAMATGEPQQFEHGYAVPVFPDNVVGQQERVA
ncbi:MAG: hypothetical protein HOV84_17415 [Streptomyces sp.]|nr:hypothetical protein [Streptomyces sp.]